MAIVAFVGGNDSEETERSMQIIWKFIHSESESNVYTQSDVNLFSRCLVLWFAADLFQRFKSSYNSAPFIDYV